MIPAASVLRVGTTVALGFHIFNITCVEESPAVTSATLENNGHDMFGRHHQMYSSVSLLRPKSDVSSFLEVYLA